MKSWFRFIAAMLICTACAGTAEEAVLNVKVDEPGLKEIVVVCHNDIKVLPLDEEGSASFVLKGKDAAYLKLFYGMESLLLYMESGDMPSLSFNGSDFKGTYVFDGEKAPAVKYLDSVNLIPLPDEDYALPFKEYREKLSKVEKDAVKLLEANDLSSAGGFVKMEKARIRYAYAAPLLMYPMAHRIMTGNMEYEPEQDYYDVVESYVVEDERLVCLDEYRAFVAEAMHILDPDGRQLTGIYPKTVAQMKFTADRFADPRIREIILHHIAAAYVDNFGVRDITEMENIYHTYVKDTLLLASYAAKHDRWDLTRPGKLSPGFRASDIDGEMHTLAEFRGKYVYIDMWATWCGPCRQETPYLKALAEEFKDAQIVFIGLSVDKDKEAWEKMVRGGEFPGVQLYLGPQSRFQEQYRVEGIPRFILLDKDGKIISNDMSRPSSEDTAEKIRNLEGIR